MSDPLVSVIIPVWNGRQHLESCLSALFAQTYSPLEIIAVDNASSDGSANFVQANFPSVQLIRNASNLGFGGGCNVGLEAAQGDILVLLNQDTIVTSDWLSTLVEVFQTLPDVGIAGGKALYPDGTLQHAGGYVDQRGGGHHYGYRQLDNGQFDERRDVDYVTGAALAISRQAFEQVGKLDDGFAPAYYEDVDWCYQVRHAGFRTVYVPTARLIHKEESRVADLTHEGMYLPQRNRVRFVLKHWPLERLKEEFMPAEEARLRDEGAEKYVTALHHAYLFHLLHLADLLAWRQKLLGSEVDEANELARVLTRLRCIVPLRPARIIVQPEPKVLADQVAFSEAEEPVPEEVPDDVAPSPPADSDKEERLPFGHRLLAELHQQWTLREHQFHSYVPKVGPFIGMIRRLWYSVAAQWSIRELIHQQNQVNALIVEMLTHLQHEQDRLRAEQQSGLAQLRAEQQSGFDSLSIRLAHLSNRLSQEADDRQRLAEMLGEYLAENGREIAEIADLLRSISAPSKNSGE